MKYRDELTPLLSFDMQGRIKKDGAQPILVFSEQGRSIGLLVEEIVDIADEKLDVKIAGDRPGTLGYALIRGMITEVIDVGFFLAGGGTLGRAA